MLFNTNDGAVGIHYCICAITVQQNFLKIIANLKEWVKLGTLTKQCHLFTHWSETEKRAPKGWYNRNFGTFTKSPHLMSVFWSYQNWRHIATDERFFFLLSNTIFGIYKLSYDTYSKKIHESVNAIWWDRLEHFLMQYFNVSKMSIWSPGMQMMVDL